MVKGQHILWDSPAVPLSDTASPPPIERELSMGALPAARTVLPSLRRLLCLSGSILPTRSQARITLDGSLGMAGPLTGPHYMIPHSVGQVRSPNLLHSFGQFNLFAGESATFTGPSTIHNILGCVTGGSRSIADNGSSM
jgi:hypothetical protein